MAEAIHDLAESSISLDAKTNTTYLRSWKLAIVITTLSLGIFLFGLDVNIIGVAIPEITTQFGSLDKVAWYGSAYLLTVTAFQPGFGSLYRYFNAKVIYLVSLCLFESELDMFSYELDSPSASRIVSLVNLLITHKLDPPFALQHHHPMSSYSVGLYLA